MLGEQLAQQFKALLQILGVLAQLRDIAVHSPFAGWDASDERGDGIADEGQLQRL